MPLEWTDGGAEKNGSADADNPFGSVRITRQPERDAYIRILGSDVTSGEVVLRAGTVLGPRQIGLLAAIGRVHAAVHPRPRVVILSTGSELVEPGNARPGADQRRERARAVRHDPADGAPSPGSASSRTTRRPARHDRGTSPRRHGHHERRRVSGRIRRGEASPRRSGRWSSPASRCSQVCRKGSGPSARTDPDLLRREPRLRLCLVRTVHPVSREDDGPGDRAARTVTAFLPRRLRLAAREASVRARDLQPVGDGAASRRVGIASGGDLALANCLIVVPEDVTRVVDGGDVGGDPAGRQAVSSAGPAGKSAGRHMSTSPARLGWSM